VPVLALTAESNLSFSGRYKFHDEYIVELEALNRRLQVAKEDPKGISADLSVIQKALESKFPNSSIVSKEVPRQPSPKPLASTASTQ